MSGCKKWEWTQKLTYSSKNSRSPGTALQAETIMGNFTEGVAPGYSDIAFQAIKDKKAYTQGQRPTHTGWRTISLEGCTERKRH